VVAIRRRSRPFEDFIEARLRRVKRLDKGTFRLPESFEEGARGVRIDERMLEDLLQGIGISIFRRGTDHTRPCDDGHTRRSTSVAVAVTTLFVSRESTSVEGTDEMRARIAMLEATLAAERERSRLLEAERDKVREAFRQLQIEMELLRRRIFAAKAERIDTAQLDLEFEAKKKELDEIADKLGVKSIDAPLPKKKHKSKGRRDLKAHRDLPVENVEITDASMETMVAAGAAVRTPSGFAKPLEAACVAAKVQRITPHGLRYTFNHLAKRLTERDVVRAITGHVTEAMTTHYDWIDLDEKRAAVTGVARLLRDSSDGCDSSSDSPSDGSEKAGEASTSNRP
jgi:hypothetical protein